MHLVAHMGGKVVQQLKDADFQPGEVDGMAIFEAISNVNSAGTH